jgi:hypothetical protein
MVQWWALVNMVMNLWVLKRQGISRLKVLKESRDHKFFPQLVRDLTALTFDIFFFISHCKLAKKLLQILNKKCNKYVK